MLKPKKPCLTELTHRLRNGGLLGLLLMRRMSIIIINYRSRCPLHGMERRRSFRTERLFQSAPISVTEIENQLKLNYIFDL